MTFPIHLDRPARNALGEGTIAHIAGRFEEAAGRPVLLTGTHAAFCAGLNLKRVSELESGSLAPFFRAVDRLFALVLLYPGPVAAAIEGHAIAGGCVLALACDYRVAADDERLRIGLNEVALGACFPPVAQRLVRFRLPPQSLLRVVLGAELHAPREALALGLLDDVAGDPRARATAWLEHAAAHPPEAFALTKRTLLADVAEPTPEDERRFLEEELPLWASEELQSRVRAALTRRA